MMKHPVLARVFSVVLAIMGLLLLLSGVSGLRKNSADNASRLAFSEKYAGRIGSFVTLRQEVDGSASYAEAAKALEKLLDAHEKSAAQHRTDTALFTAERGGYKMGEELIVTARDMLDAYRQEMHDAKAMRGLLEGVINQALAEQKNSMPWLDNLTNALLRAAGQCCAESGKFTLAICELTLLMETEPQPGEMLDAPAVPELPDEPVMPFAADQGFGAPDPGSYEQMLDAYTQLGAAYTRAMEDYAASWADYSDALYAYQSAQAQQGYNRVSQEQYQWAHAQWEQECRRARSGVDFGAASSLARSQRALAVTLAASSSGALAALLDRTGEFPDLGTLVELVDSAERRLDELSRLDPESLTNEEFLEKAGEAQDILDTLAEAFTAIAARISNPGALIAEALEKLRVTALLVRYLDSMLARAEKELQTQLENMWYMLGEAEKDRVRLETEKLGLDAEAELLRKRSLTTEQLHELHNSFQSARQLVLAVPEVREAVRAGGEEEESARAYLAAYREDTERLFRGRRLLNALAVLGGAMGMAGIPAAFEKLRGRFWLLAPVLLCLGCAAGAEGLKLFLGLGQMYTALVTAIFALLQLLIVLPKKKRPAYQARH